MTRVDVRNIERLISSLNKAFFQYINLMSFSVNKKKRFYLPSSAYFNPFSWYDEHFKSQFKKTTFRANTLFPTFLNK